MEQNGLFNWSNGYPSTHEIDNDIDQNALYVLKDSEYTIGAITLLDLVLPEYKEQLKISGNERCLTVKRLAVDPGFQRQGFAGELMEFAEIHAKANQFDFIRLDAYIQNVSALNFYRKRGYKTTGQIQLPDLDDCCIAFEYALK